MSTYLGSKGDAMVLFNIERKIKILIHLFNKRHASFFVHGKHPIQSLQAPVLHVGVPKI